MTQTCTFESQLSVPCESSADFFYLNNRIGEKTNFHTDDDFKRIAPGSKRSTFDLTANRAPQLLKAEKAFVVEDDEESNNSLEDGF